MLFLPLDDEKRKAARGNLSNASSAMRASRCSDGATFRTSRAHAAILRGAACRRSGRSSSVAAPRYPMTASLERKLVRHPQTRDQRSARFARPDATRSCFTSAASRPSPSFTKVSSSRRRFREFFPDLIDPGSGDRAGDGASALLHQHVPELGSRAPVSLRRP